MSPVARPANPPQGWDKGHQTFASIIYYLVQNALTGSPVTKSAVAQLFGVSISVFQRVLAGDRGKAATHLPPSESDIQTRPEERFILVADNQQHPFRGLSSTSRSASTSKSRQAAATAVAVDPVEQTQTVEDTPPVPPPSSSSSSSSTSVAEPPVKRQKTISMPPPSKIPPRSSSRTASTAASGQATSTRSSSSGTVSATEKGKKRPATKTKCGDCGVSHPAERGCRPCPQCQAVHTPEDDCYQPDDEEEVPSSQQRRYPQCVLCLKRHEPFKPCHWFE